MNNLSLAFRDSGRPETGEVAAWPVSELESLIDEWIADCQARMHSKATIRWRIDLTGKFRWWLRQNELTHCGAREIRAFLNYLRVPHKDGRWGNPHLTGEVKPYTIHAYYRTLRTLFNWIAADLEMEGVAFRNPMKAVGAPVARMSDVKPYSADEIRRFMEAAKRSRNSARNVALIAFLLDTGARASEVCSLRRGDVDLKQTTSWVMGKGGKGRKIVFSPTVARLLFRYFRVERQSDDAPLFVSECGGSFTRVSLYHLICNLGKEAGVDGANVHKFRHTFAVEILRGGGHTFGLQAALGHSSMAMTRRYVELVDADIVSMHRLASPAARLLGKGGKR